jgi:hypothetical protein
VDGAGQQPVDLVGRQVDELLGQREHLAHAHTQDDIYIGGGVGIFAGLEVAPELVALDRRAARLQLGQERVGGAGVAMCVSTGGS